MPEAHFLNDFTYGDDDMLLVTSNQTVLNESGSILRASYSSNYGCSQKTALHARPVKSPCRSSTAS